LNVFIKIFNQKAKKRKENSSSRMFLKKTRKKLNFLKKYLRKTLSSFNFFFSSFFFF